MIVKVYLFMSTKEVDILVKQGVDIDVMIIS